MITESPKVGGGGGATRVFGQTRPMEEVVVKCFPVYAIEYEVVNIISTWNILQIFINKPINIVIYH